VGAGVGEEGLGGEGGAGGGGGLDGGSHTHKNARDLCGGGGGGVRGGGEGGGEEEGRALEGEADVDVGARGGGRDKGLGVPVGHVTTAQGGNDGEGEGGAHIPTPPQVSPICLSSVLGGLFCLYNRSLLPL
jgi:hypothetical protein